MTDPREMTTGEAEAYRRGLNEGVVAGLKAREAEAQGWRGTAAAAQVAVPAQAQESGQGMCERGTCQWPLTCSRHGLCLKEDAAPVAAEHAAAGADRSPIGIDPADPDGLARFTTNWRRWV